MCIYGSMWHNVCVFGSLACYFMAALFEQKSHKWIMVKPLHLWSGEQWRRFPLELNAMHLLYPFERNLATIMSPWCGFSALIGCDESARSAAVWVLVKRMSSAARLDLALKHTSYVYLMTARYILSLGWLWKTLIKNCVESDYVTRVYILMNTFKMFCKAFAFISLTLKFGGKWILWGDEIHLLNLYRRGNQISGLPV